MYLARDLLSNQTVAVKKSFFSGDNAARRGFEAEAKLLARLKHEGLPKVLDYFILENSFQALVMDYVEGETLAEVLESGRQRTGRGLNPALVLNWALQILSILKYLHNFEPPVIHRDIKPNNIKINAAGKIILLDFGLAKGSAVTIVGGMSGYSPIEQVNRTGTDPRSDIYALGTTLFHLLTDDYPLTALERFRNVYCPDAPIAEDGNDVISRPIALQRTVSEINPQVPPVISEIIMKAMALMPEDRFQTVEEMKSALAPAMRSVEPFSTDNIAEGRVNTIIYAEKHPSLLDDDEELSDPPENRSEPLQNLEESEKFVPIDVSLSEARPDQAGCLSTASAPDLIFENKVQKSTNSHSPHLPPTEFSGKNTVFFKTGNFSLKIPPRKSGKKILTASIGGLVILLLGSAGILVWYLFVPVTPKEISEASADKIAALTSTEKAKNPLNISIFRSGKKNEKIILNDDYQFAVSEKFKFLISSPKDGFLYIISRDNQSKASLAYPKPDQKDNYLKANSETVFPLDNTFEFTENTPTEIWIYFIILSSREADLAKRIPATLKYGIEKSTTAGEVEKLIEQLDKIAENSVGINRKTADLNDDSLVGITKIQKKL